MARDPNGVMENLPMSPMNRITGHHSAGPHKPTATDRKHYHRIVDGDGQVHAGDRAITDNAPGRPFTSGTYAAHTRNLNSGNIGLSMSCMAKAQWANPRACSAYPTAAQIDAFCREAARLCREWSVQPERETLLSHAEVEITLRVPQKGKWDFDYSLLGRTFSRDPVAVGDEWRQEVRRILGSPIIAPPMAPGARPTLQRGSVGEHVRVLQSAIKVAPVDGAFGPATFAAVVAYQRRNNLRPDGVVGRMTWAALGL